MKKILILCASVLVLGSTYMAYLFSRPEHYGKPFGNVPFISISQSMQKNVTGTVRVEGEIVRQCPVSGCWFYLTDGKGHQLKAELGNTLPVLPKKIGHKAEVEGTLIPSADEPTLAGIAVEVR
jgi:hypothetical protein